MDIIIFSGQSNMQGETEGLPENNEVVKGALEYRLLSDSLIPLQHPVGEDIAGDELEGAYKGCGTLVPAFCRAYAKKTGREVVAVHAARGSTVISQWLRGTKRHEWAVKKAAGAIAKAKELGEIGHIYFVWLQGESDAIIKTTEDEYYERLIALKNEWKEEIGIEKFCIIKVGYFTSVASWIEGDIADKKARDETIMRAQERAAADDADFVILTRICTELSRTSAYINPNVGGHYCNEAMDIIGTVAGEALARNTL